MKFPLWRLYFAYCLKPVAGWRLRRIRRTACVKIKSCYGFWPDDINVFTGITDNLYRFVKFGISIYI